MEKGLAHALLGWVATETMEKLSQLLPKMITLKNMRRGAGDLGLDKEREALVMRLLDSLQPRTDESDRSGHNCEEEKGPVQNKREHSQEDVSDEPRKKKKARLRKKSESHELSIGSPVMIKSKGVVGKIIKLDRENQQCHVRGQDGGVHVAVLGDLEKGKIDGKFLKFFSASDDKLCRFKPNSVVKGLDGESYIIWKKLSDQTDDEDYVFEAIAMSDFRIRNVGLIGFMLARQNLARVFLKHGQPVVYENQIYTVDGEGKVSHNWFCFDLECSSGRKTEIPLSSLQPISLEEVKKNRDYVRSYVLNCCNGERVMNEIIEATKGYESAVEERSHEQMRKELDEDYLASENNSLLEAMIRKYDNLAEGGRLLLLWRLMEKAEGDVDELKKLWNKVDQSGWKRTWNAKTALDYQWFAEIVGQYDRFRLFSISKARDARARLCIELLVHELDFNGTAKSRDGILGKVESDFEPPSPSHGPGLTFFYWD